MSRYVPFAALMRLLLASLLPAQEKRVNPTAGNHIVLGRLENGAAGTHVRLAWTRMAAGTLAVGAGCPRYWSPPYLAAVDLCQSPARYHRAGRV